MNGYFPYLSLNTDLTHPGRKLPDIGNSTCHQKRLWLPDRIHPSVEHYHERGKVGWEDLGVWREKSKAPSFTNPTLSAAEVLWFQQLYRF